MQVGISTVGTEELIRCILLVIILVSLVVVDISEVDEVLIIGDLEVLVVVLVFVVVHLIFVQRVTSLKVLALIDDL